MISVRKAAAATAALALGVVLLNGCAPAPEGGGDGSQVTLSVWSWRPEDKAAYEQIFDVYEASHPGVTIEFKPFKNTEYDTILSTGLAGEGGPDIAQVRTLASLLSPLVEAKQLLPLDQAVVPNLKNFKDDILAGTQVAGDENFYGVPLGVSTLQMYYNKAIFEQNNLEVPRTWDDFLKLNDALLEAGITPIEIGAKDDWVLPISLSVLAGSEWSPELVSGFTDGSRSVDDPEFASAIDAFASLQPYIVENPTGVSYTESQTAFGGGLAAMFPGGSWELAGFQDAGLNVGTFAVPPIQSDGKPVVPSFPDGAFGVSAATKHPEEALEFANWLASPEFGQSMVNTLKQLSPIAGVAPSDAGLEALLADYAELSVPYVPRLFATGKTDTQGVLASGLQAVLGGSADTATVVSDYASAIQKAYAQ